MVVVDRVAVDVDVDRIEVFAGYFFSRVETVVVCDSQAVAGLIRLGIEVGDIDAVGAVVSLLHLYEEGAVLIHSVSVGRRNERSCCVHSRRI